MADRDRTASPDPNREARIQRILKELEWTLRDTLPHPQQPLERIEKQSQQIGRKISDLIERETLASTGRGYAGSHTPCRCGTWARYVTDLERCLITLNGSRQLSRAYYHCAHCHHGFCPLDARLGIGPGECSVGVRALTARFSSYLPFLQATGELEAVTGIRVSGRTTAREAQAVGEALQAIWREREERLWAGKAEPPPERPGLLQITMDGVQLPIGKGFREARVGCVYQPRDGGGVERAQ